MRRSRGTASRRAGLAALVALLSVAPAPAQEAGPRDLVLASTTSTEDSGLFDVLVPAFERAHPRWRVRVVAVGTGEALRLGEHRDADVLLVHAPAAESAFVAAGHGLERRDVMYNDFVVVGPAADPARVRGSRDAAAALRRVAAAGATFVSRGDESGTHLKERGLWQAAGVRPGGRWYKSVGQGMGATLWMADEMRAYTLADRATFQSQNGLGLQVLVEGDPRLFNPYGVILVAGAREPEGARAFADWITSPAGQRVIGEFGRARHGGALFHPNARGERS